MKTPGAKRLITYKERSYNSHYKIDDVRIRDSYIFIKSRKKTKTKKPRYRYIVDTLLWDKHTQSYKENKDVKLSLGSLRVRVDRSQEYSITPFNDPDFSAILAKITLIS